MSDLSQVKDTIRKLLNLAADDAATEGEVNNAIRFARKLMLKHQLSEGDCVESQEADEERIARAACIRMEGNSGSAKLSQWEAQLGAFVCRFVGGVKCYAQTRVQRRVNGVARQANGDPGYSECGQVVFYGIAEDVALAQRTWNDLTVIIASMARIKWGGVFRGPGREYCEGFVLGLFTQLKEADAEQKASESTALVVRRDALIAAKEARAKGWLTNECGVKLYSRSSGSGGAYHGDARSEGQRDGATTTIAGRSAKLTASHRPQLPR